jgi:hypothetical protein
VIRRTDKAVRNRQPRKRSLHTLVDLEHVALAAAADRDARRRARDRLEPALLGQVERAREYDRLVRAEIRRVELDRVRPIALIGLRDLVRQRAGRACAPAGVNGGIAGAGGAGGGGFGGGLFNYTGAVVSITAPKHVKSSPLSSFTANLANGGGGGNGGMGGGGGGGAGVGVSGVGAPGGFGTGGVGGAGGPAGRGSGGGLFNGGTASFIGITVNFSANRANGSLGGQGGDGGSAGGGNGGTGAVGGTGGNASSGTGGGGSGGGIDNATGGVLAINPRLSAKKGSKQARATNLGTTNQAHVGQEGAGGAAGNFFLAGTGGSPGGMAGQSFPGNHGTAGFIGPGIGGGLNLESGGTAVIDNTTVTGNQASTSGDNVSGAFSM